MSQVAIRPATFADLMRIERKAELIRGRIVEFMPTGILPHRIARRISRSLEDYVQLNGRGEVGGDNLGYAIDPPLSSGRQSFSPDASYYDGPLPNNLMDFIYGPPTFAVEVRSKSDCGPSSDRDYEEKRSDYFEAGTLVVWDVDPEAQVICSYTADDPTNPIAFRKGDLAHAEPSLPGWRLKVDDLFA